MTRFDRLEFGGNPATTDPQPDPRAPNATPTAPAPADLRDEHFWLAKALEERRDGLYENALRFYSRALELNKALPEGWLGQAQMLVALGEYKEAELWARKALELFKNNGDLIAARAHALARLNKPSEALPLSDASFQREGQSPYRWIVRAECLLVSGSDAEAHCFDKALALDKHWLLPLEIALIYRYRHKSSKALLRIRQALEKAPDSAYAWYIQGLCELDLGMTPAAIKSFKRCLDLKPGYTDARNQLNELNREAATLSGKIKRIFRRA